MTAPRRSLYLSNSGDNQVKPRLLHSLADVVTRTLTCCVTIKSWIMVKQLLRRKLGHRRKYFMRLQSGRENVFLKIFSQRVLKTTSE